MTRDPDVWWWVIPVVAEKGSVHCATIVSPSRRRNSCLVPLGDDRLTVTGDFNGKPG